MFALCWGCVLLSSYPIGGEVLGVIDVTKCVCMICMSLPKGIVYFLTHGLSAVMLEVTIIG